GNPAAAMDCFAALAMTGSARDERIGRDRFAVFLYRQHPAGRRRRAIGALQARADRAGGANGSRRRGPEVEAVGISDARRMLHVAAEPDRKQRVIAKVRADWALDRPADREEALTVRGLDQLADRLPRRLECGMQVPARTGPAEVREGEALAAITLGDVP